MAKRVTWPQTLTYPPAPIVVTVSKGGKASRHIWKKDGLRGGLVEETAPYKLSMNHEDAYAFYFQKLDFGYGRAVEINTYVHRPTGRKVAGVRYMSGNASGLTPEGKARTTKDPLTMNWTVLKEEFYRTREEALHAIRGTRDWVSGQRGRRKPLRPLTAREVKAWLEGPVKP